MKKHGVLVAILCLMFCSTQLLAHMSKSHPDTLPGSGVDLKVTKANFSDAIQVEQHFKKRRTLSQIVSFRIPEKKSLVPAAELNLDFTSGLAINLIPTLFNDDPTECFFGRMSPTDCPSKVAGVPTRCPGGTIKPTQCRDRVIATRCWANQTPTRCQFKSTTCPTGRMPSYCTTLDYYHIVPTRCPELIKATRCAKRTVPTNCPKFILATNCDDGIKSTECAQRLVPTHCDATHIEPTICLEGETHPSLCSNGENIATHCPDDEIWPTFCEEGVIPTICFKIDYLSTACPDKALSTYCEHDQEDLATICPIGEEFEVIATTCPRETKPTCCLFEGNLDVPTYCPEKVLFTQCPHGSFGQNCD